MRLVNRQTGEEATDAQYEAARLRAEEIIDSPYSSPEQIEWALGFPSMEFRFWESNQQRGIRQRRTRSQT